MIARTTLTLLACLLIVPLFAQKDNDKDNEKFNGLRAGWHLSNFDGDQSFDARNGYYGGYYRNLIKVPVFSFSTGLEANTAGAKKDGFERRLTYVGIPINGRLKLGPVYFDLGVDAALKVHEKSLLDGNEVDLTSDDKAQDFDFLAHAGAGFKFLFLAVEVRYRYGITEVYDGYRNTGLEVGLTTFF